MLSFITRSGTEYQVSFTQTQQVVVRWEDPTGNPLQKGSGVKVWEECVINGVEYLGDGRWKVAKEALEGLLIQGTDRYLRGTKWEAVSWHTTPIQTVLKYGEVVWQR